MKVSKKEVESWLKYFPQFRARARMYEATHFFVLRALGSDFTSEHVAMSIIVHRRLQDILPNDYKGVTLEKEWRSEEGMKSLVEFAEEQLGGRRVIERNGITYLDPRV